MSAEQSTPKGAQRLSIERLKEFEKLEYGMFIHYGMSTFVGCELPNGLDSSTEYAPTNLDVDQWIRVAADVGMKYAVLTSKHVSGHCLWHSKYTDYHVGTSSDKTDVMAEFVNACAKHNIKPGFYYCSWDNHHRRKFGDVDFNPMSWNVLTDEYLEFQMNQVEEINTLYGPWMEFWIDIPGALGAVGRKKMYEHIAKLSPDSIIMLNNGFGDGSSIDLNYSWPSDIVAIERFLPNSNKGFNPWHTITPEGEPTGEYYIPGEICDPIAYQWFWEETDPLRSDQELLGMRLISKTRGTNLLLDVPPDRTGQLPKATVDSLVRLANNFAKQW